MKTLNQVLRVSIRALSVVMICTLAIAPEAHSTEVSSSQRAALDKSVWRMHADSLLKRRLSSSLEETLINDNRLSEAYIPAQYLSSDFKNSADWSWRMQEWSNLVKSQSLRSAVGLLQRSLNGGSASEFFFAREQAASALRQFIGFLFSIDREAYLRDSASVGSGAPTFIPLEKHADASLFLYFHLFPDKSFDEVFGQLRSSSTSVARANLMKYLGTSAPTPKRSQLGLVAESECSASADLPRQFAKETAHIPVFNQGRTGVCYAFAATTIINYIHAVTGSGQSSTSGSNGNGEARVYPWLPSAIRYTLARNEFSSNQTKAILDALDGGGGQDIMKDGLENGFCVGGDRIIDNTDVTSSLIQFAEASANIVSASQDPAVRKSLWQKRRPFEWMLASFTAMTKNGESTQSFMGMMEKMLCNEKLYLNATQRSVLDRASQGELGVDRMTANLNRHFSARAKLPVLTRICSKGLTQPSQTPLWGIWPKTDEADCKRHAVVVLGQRYSQERKSCEYRMRNSWGEKPKMLEHFPHEPNGDVWLSNAEMRALVYGLYTYSTR